MSDGVREAVVLAEPDDAAVRVAGVPLLVRTILLLQRAGVERVHIPATTAVPKDARIRVPPERGTTPSGAHLVVGPATVVDQAVVRAASAAAGAVRWERDGARIERREAGAPAPRAVAPPAGLLLPASTPRAALEHALLRALENPRDGYLDGLLNRRLSRPLTRALLRTPLTPNHVTVIGVCLGIAGGLLLGAPTTAGIVAGVAALLVSGVLDCCDGEIARIKLTESRIGHLLDIVGDTLVHAALLGGIAMQLARTGAWPGAGTLALLALGVAGSFAAITWSEQTETRRRLVVDAWENRLIDGVLSPLTTRDWYVFPVAFALAGRLDVLLPAAAWGAQAFWAAVAVLVWRVLRRAPAHVHGSAARVDQ